MNIFENIDYELDLINKEFAQGNMTQTDYEERVFLLYKNLLDEERKEYEKCKNQN